MSDDKVNNLFFNVSSAIYSKISTFPFLNSGLKIVIKVILKLTPTQPSLNFPVLNRYRESSGLW